ncbi:MAG: hypothetical protein ACYC7D_12750 [Nitrososphaerales archaeon]
MDTSLLQLVLGKMSSEEASNDCKKALNICIGRNKKIYKINSDGAKKRELAEYLDELAKEDGLERGIKLQISKKSKNRLGKHIKKMPKGKTRSDCNASPGRAFRAD